MGWQESSVFKNICRLVLISFYFQTIHPGNLGYGPGGFRWPSIGFNEAQAAITPAVPISNNVAQPPVSTVAKAAPVIPPQLAPDDYLGSTREANTSDPYIIQKATELNHDPALIFAFVRDQIGNEVYKGSLRGARGTLWSKAGNALDKASLMVALLRSSNIKARYAGATLTDEKAKQIINSMFKMPLNVVGCPDENAPRAEPDKNVDLLAEAKDHYWVEFDQGGGFQAADPSFASQPLGTPVLSPITSFNEVPDNLRHKVTVRLKREFDAPLGNGNDRDVKAVLEHTFTTVELVGKPVSVGHFVNSTGGFFGPTHNYSPYLLIGQGDADISDDEIIRGEDYQEVFSSFGGILGSQILSGLFVEYEVFDVQGNSQLYERAMVDRVGFAARQTGEKVTVDSTADGGPTVSTVDMVTANIMPGLQEPLALKPQLARLVKLEEQYNSIKPALDAIPITGAETDEQKQLQANALEISRNLTTVTGENIGMTFGVSSDLALSQLEKGYMTKGYFVSPKITIVQAKAEVDKLKFVIDLRKNDIRSMSYPGQIDSIGFPFEMMRGLMESTLEGKVLAANIGQAVVSVGDVFAAVQNDNEIVQITPKNMEKIGFLDISAEAKARITKAVNKGYVVATPTHHVTVVGKKIIKWLEIDPKSGQTISVSEDGGHSDALEYAFLINNFGSRAAFLVIGAGHGYAVAQFTFIGEILQGINNSTGIPPINDILKKAKQEVEFNLLLTLNQFGIGEIIGTAGLRSVGLKALACGFFSDEQPGILQFFNCMAKEAVVYGLKLDQLVTAYDFGLIIGMGVALDWIHRNFPVDPPVFPFLSSDLAPVPAPLQPNSQSVISLKIAADPLFTYPVSNVQVPSVFKAQIQNSGPSTDTFKLAFSSIPVGYKAQASIPEVTVPPGATAEVGLCIKPESDVVPSSGSTIPFKLSVTSASNPSITNSSQAQVLIPDLHEVSLIFDQPSISVTPGGLGSGKLTIVALGNVAEQLTLQSTLPTGLQLSGLPATVSLAAGETKSFPITITTDASLTIGQSLDLVINANLAGTLQPTQRKTTLQVNLRSAQGVTLDNAVQQSSGGSNTQLPTLLSELRTTLDQWTAAPSDARFCESAKLQVNNLGKLVSGDPLLSGYSADINSLRLFAQNCSLTNLQSFVPPLFTKLAEASAMGVTIAFAPNASFTQPGNLVTTQLTLKNRSKNAATVSLALQGLPAGVVSAFPTNTVQLAPGASQNLAINLTPLAAGRYPFSAVAQVAGFTKTAKASGLLVSGQAAVNVLSVSGSPAFILKDGQTQITTLVANTAGIPTKAKAVVNIKGPNGVSVYQSPTPILLDIPDGDTNIPLELDVVKASGWVEQSYTIELSLVDITNKLIPGGQGTGTLNVGTPIIATASVNPIRVPPGNGKVTTSINVQPRFTGLGGTFGLEPTDMNKDRINWAAASRGSSITITSQSSTNGTAAALIDELPNSDPFSHWVGQTLGSTPGNFLLDLGQQRTIDVLQFHIWDGDNRFTRYRVEGSLDNQTFFPLADKSSGEHQGLQRITFQATNVRYIRITGLFDSVDAGTFYLYDEILAIGDGAGLPVPTQTVTVDGIANSGIGYSVGKKLSLNAGIYEITRQQGAISIWPNDTDNNGKTWGSSLRVSMPFKNYQADPVLNYPTAADVETAIGAQHFKMYLPAHSDVYFWAYDNGLTSDNRGDETFEIRQISGPNDSLPVQVRDAMMRSVLWEQTDVAGWENWTKTTDYNCSGCHVQSQASSGLAVSKQKLPELPIDADLQAKFVDAYKVWQNPEGWVSPFHGGGFAVTQTSLWAWAVSRFNGRQLDSLSTNLVSALDWLLGKQTSTGAWEADHCDGTAQQIYCDGSPSATHTAGNIQALAKMIGYLADKPFIDLPADQAAINGGQIETITNKGTSFDFNFNSQAKVTGIRITVSDTYADNGNFVINELEAFDGSLSKVFNSATANFEQGGFPITNSFDGIKNLQDNGWAYGTNTRLTPAQGMWVFSAPTDIDRIRLTHFYPNHQLKKLKIEVTSDTNPTINSQFVEVTNLRIGQTTTDRVVNYRDAIAKAANALSAVDWPFTRNTRTTAQTIIGLTTALPFLTGNELNGAVQRINAAEQQLRSTQRENGGWNDANVEVSQSLASAQALDALLLVTKNSTDPAIVAGAGYLIQSQKNEGSWSPPPGLARRLASTTWVEIALPTIFENLASITLGVDHRVPLGTKGEPLANSFNPVLDKQTASANETNLHWSSLLNNDTGQIFSLVSDLKDMLPGEVRQISQGTTVNYSSVAGNGKVELAPLYLNAQHIVQVTPSQTPVVAGNTATVTVAVENLLNHDDTFNFNLAGLPDGSTVTPAPITLAAGGKTNLQLPITVPVSSLPGNLNFSVAVDSVSGVKDSASAVLSVTENTSSPPFVGLDTEALDLSLLNNFSSAGKGTTAHFKLRLTNMGTDNASYNLGASGLPVGFLAVFSSENVSLSPGLSNFREVDVAISTPKDFAKGNFPVVFTAVSTNNPLLSKQVSGSISVSDFGVSLAFEPKQSGPNTVFGLWVTNTGSVADIFDITLGGTGSLGVSLNQTSIALNAGATWEAFITLPNYNWSLPGALSLIAQATSRSDSSVVALDTATIAIASNKSMTAVSNPSIQVLAAPGSANFTIEVKNTGNVEDEYSAVITQKTGVVDASLKGLDGNPTQQIAVFRLPGLATGNLNLTANSNQPGTGTVSVLIKSNTTNAISSVVTAQLNVSGVVVNHPPVANAGASKNVVAGEVVALDGSSSSDPDGNLLTDYRWRFAAVPAGSLLADAGIQNNHTPKPSFVSDKPGVYRLELVVSDGLTDSLPAFVEFTAAKPNMAPIANAGENKNVVAGVVVTLDGSNSSDPDGDLLNDYRWRFVAVPAGSLLVDAGIQNNHTPNPRFVSDLSGVYRLELIVSDGKANSLPAFVEVTAAKPNVAPNANAGLDQSVAVRKSVILDGSGSIDPDGGPSILQFAWRLNDPLQSGQVTLTNAGTASPSFSASAPGVYDLVLRVFDGKDSAEDVVSITVTPSNVPPVADAGQDLAIQLGQSVLLNATASHDTDLLPLPLTYTWSFVSLPITSKLGDQSIQTDTNNPAKATFVPDVLGDFVVKLKVFDGLDEATDNLLVKVLPALIYQEVNDLVRVIAACPKTVFDKKTNKVVTSATLTLINKSLLDIKKPIRVVFELSSSNISIQGAKTDDKGRKYLELTNELLKPGDSAKINVQFIYPKGIKFSYKKRIFGAVSRTIPTKSQQATNSECECEDDGTRKNK